MKTLILMRHTKAAAHAPEMADIDRPLAPRGIDNAKALGAWLAAAGLVPDVALVSAAQRTRETWELLGLEATTPVKLLAELYDAVPAGYLAPVAKLDCDTVMIVGHNPTIASLAEHLLRETEIPVDLSAYPTGATIVVTLEGEDWQTALKAPGHLANWTVPRALDAPA